MDIEKLIEAVKLCGSTPKVDQCKQCAYWSGGDMSKCIPRMTTAAATALSTLQAELEQVKQELDAAVSWAQKYTESIDRPCVACKHNIGDYVCTAICRNCGPMGTESCKWEFDFSGELKED